MTTTVQDPEYIRVFQKALVTDTDFAGFRYCSNCQTRTKHERIGKSDKFRCAHCKTEHPR